MAKLYGTRIIPLDERILIRIPETATKHKELLVAAPNPLTGKVEVSSAANAKRGKNCGIVVDVGPGQKSSTTGERIPIDKNITPGCEVHFEVMQGCTPFRPPAMAEEMEEEGLWFIIESAVVCVLRPAGVEARRPVLV